MSSSTKLERKMSAVRDQIEAKQAERRTYMFDLDLDAYKKCSAELDALNHDWNILLKERYPKIQER